MSQQRPEKESTGRVDVRGLLDPELGPVLGAFELPALDADAIRAWRTAGPEGKDAP